MNKMTHTVGYFNGNPWPVQIAVAKFNMMLTLNPGEYILDRSGNKINDPYFEVFVVNKHLQKEVSDTPVPCNYLPEFNQYQAGASAHSLPVYSVTKNEEGGWKIPENISKNPSMPAIIGNSGVIKAMSMEEARRLGFVRKAREVPENYGVDDTTGVPPRNAPPIKVAIDPSIKQSPVAIPKDMLNIPDNVPNPEVRTSLLSNLASQATTVKVEEPKTPIKETQTPLLKEDIQKQTSVSPQPSSFPPPIQAGVPKDAPVSNTNMEFPLPQLDEDEEMEDIEYLEETSTNSEIVSDSIESPAEDMPSQSVQEKEIPKLVQNQNKEQIFKALTKKTEPKLPENKIQNAQTEQVEQDYKQPADFNRYKCPICKTGFKFRSQLDRHYQRVHSKAGRAVE